MDKTTVGNLCKPYIGQLKLDDNTLIDYFDIASVDNIEKQITGYTTYKFAEAPSRARKKVEKGNILVSTVRPNLNAVALFDEETENMPVASTGFCVLECKANTSPRFLFRYLQSQSFVRAMVSQATGASYPAVSDKIVRDTKLPAYSYEEQIQIANVLDATANIISKRKHQLQKLDELVKARFIEMFGDPVVNKKGWDAEILNNLCNGIGDGLHGTPEYDDAGKYAFINGNNLMNGAIEVTPSTKMVNAETFGKYYIEISENAILLSINGTLGKLAFYNGEEIILGKSACYCNLKSEINREFVYGVMQTNAFSNFLERNATASTIKNVGLKAIREFRLILPPEGLQKQFVKFSKQVDKSKAVAQKALDEAQLLFDSLMQKYFG